MRRASVLSSTCALGAIVALAACDTREIALGDVQAGIFLGACFGAQTRCDLQPDDELSRSLPLPEIAPCADDPEIWEIQWGQRAHRSPPRTPEQRSGQQVSPSPGIALGPDGSLWVVSSNRTEVAFERFDAPHRVVGPIDLEVAAGHPHAEIRHISLAVSKTGRGFIAFVMRVSNDDEPSGSERRLTRRIAIYEIDADGELVGAPVEVSEVHEGLLDDDLKGILVATTEDDALLVSAQGVGGRATIARLCLRDGVALGEHPARDLEWIQTGATQARVNALIGDAEGGVYAVGQAIADQVSVFWRPELDGSLAAYDGRGNLRFQVFSGTQELRVVQREDGNFTLVGVRTRDPLIAEGSVALGLSLVVFNLSAEGELLASVRFPISQRTELTELTTDAENRVYAVVRDVDSHAQVIVQLNPDGTCTTRQVQWYARGSDAEERRSPETAVTLLGSQAARIYFTYESVIGVLEP